jgi:hypothetical protein
MVRTTIVSGLAAPPTPVPITTRVLLGLRMRRLRHRAYQKAGAVTIAKRIPQPPTLPLAQAQIPP